MTFGFSNLEVRGEGDLSEQTSLSAVVELVEETVGR